MRCYSKEILICLSMMLGPGCRKINRLKIVLTVWALVILSSRRGLAVYRCHGGGWFCRPSEDLDREELAGEVSVPLASDYQSIPPSSP